MMLSPLPETFLPEEDPVPQPDRRCEADWQAGVERLYRHRADRLIRHFAGQSRDHDGARDLVHEAFSRLAGLSFARRLAVARPDSYLYRICLNLFHDRGRAEAANRLLAAKSADEPAVGDLVAQLECRDTLRRLEQAMLRLKPKTRAIFLARRLDGLSYAEIAERTGLSVWGVEKQMAKAIEIIDRLMDRD
jgi:RNA polymerase sigma-70 factor (ECF subfamily)